jgi:hypothetical protein
MKKKAGLADSPFFASAPNTERLQATSVFPEIQLQKGLDDQLETETSQHGIVVSRYHDTTIEFVRQSVKEFGKEAATHRFTPAEKRSIANIIHALNMQGIRTNENTITRIAINFVIDEFNQRGKDSLLGLVLQALNK